MDRWLMRQPFSGTGPGKTAYAVARMGMLLALALILQLVEAMLPPLGLPGVKLGLANTVTLLTLLLWGWRQALLLVLLRQVLAGILTGKLFSVGFYLGLAGGLSAIAVMQFWLLIFRSRAGLTTTSMAGALGHNWGQWLAAFWLIDHQALVWYLPFLTAAALPCGCLVACLCRPLGGTLAGKGWSPAVGPREVVVLLLLVLAGFGPPLAVVGARETGAVAKVQVAGQVVATLDLSQEGQRCFQAGGLEYVLKVQQGGVRVIEADCPDQVCVQTGWIAKQGQAIICVPGRLIITVEQGGSPEADGLLP